MCTPERDPLGRPHRAWGGPPQPATSPVQQLAHAEHELAVDVLADYLRRQHLDAVGVTKPLPWAVIQGPERAQWLDAARVEINARKAAPDA